MSSIDAQIAGQAAVIAQLETSDFYRALSKAEKDLKSWGQNIAKMGAVAFAAGGAGLALLRPAIQEFATAQQLFGRFSSVFGELEVQAKEFANTVATDVNQSVLTVQDSLAQFQAMFRGAGFNPEQAFRLSKWATQASQDLLAFDDNLANVDEAVQKVRSGLMGEIQPVIAYGADVRVENAKREARNYGIAVKGVMSIQDQLITRIGIMDKAFQRGKIFGQAAREVNTLASRLRGLQAALRDLRVAVGAALEGPVTTSTAALTFMIRKAIDFINANQGLVRSFAILSTILVAVGAAITVVGLAAVVLGSTFGAVTSAMTAAPWLALQLAFQVIAAAIRGQLVRALALLSRAFLSGTAVARSIISYFLGVGKAILSLGAYAKAGLAVFGTAFASAFSIVWKRLKSGDVKGAFKDLKDTIVAVVGVIVAEVKYWWVTFTGLFAGGSARIRQIVQTLGNLLTAWWNRLVILLDVTGVLEPFIYAWEKVKGAAIAAWAVIVQATQTAVTFIRELIRDPLAAIQRLWEATKAAFIRGWNSLVAIVYDVTQTIVLYLQDLWKQISETAVAWWTYMTQVIVDAWWWATDQIAKILGSLLPYLKTAYTAIRETIVGSFIIITEFLQEKWAAAMDYLYKVFEPVIDAISSAWGWLSNQFTQTIDLIQTAWTRFWSQSLTESILDFQEIAGQTFLYLWSLFDKTLDYEGAIGELSLDYEKKREEARRRIAEEEQRRKGEQDAINALAQAGAYAAREEARKKREAADRDRKAAHERLAGLRDWQDAQGKAIDANLKKQEEMAKMPPPVPPGQGPTGSGQVEVSTGFVNSALQKAFGIGEDTAMDQVAQNTNETAKGIAITNKKLDKLGPNVAP